MADAELKAEEEKAPEEKSTKSPNARQNTSRQFTSWNKGSAYFTASVTSQSALVQRRRKLADHRRCPRRPIGN